MILLSDIYTWVIIIRSNEYKVVMSTSQINPKPNAIAKQIQPKLPLSISQKSQESNSLSFFR